GFSRIATHGGEDQQVIVAQTGREETDTEPAIVPHETVSTAHVERWIKKVLASIMHLDVDEIDSSVPFKSYGIDSLISMELINPFKDVIGYLPATVLFEYPSVSKLAEYFMRDHASALERYLLAKPEKPPSAASVGTPATARDRVMTFVR